MSVGRVSQKDFVPNLGEHGRENVRDICVTQLVHERIALALDVFRVGGPVDGGARSAVGESCNPRFDKVVDIK
jgi:hypothetical protein